MTISQTLKEYFEETPIHGFGFIRRSSSVKTTVFWAIIIIAGYGLATNDLITLIIVYQSVPTLINIEVHRRSELEHPVPVFCIEINNFLVPPPEKHGGNASIHKYVPMLLDVTKGLTEVPEYLNYYVGVEDYFPYDIFYYTYAMLGFISAFQIYESQHDYDSRYPGNFERALLDKRNLSSYMSKDVPYIEELFLTYRRHNTSFEKLMQFVSMIICGNYISTNQGYNYASFERQTQYFPVCDFGSFTHLSFGLVCVRLANSTVWSRKNFDMTIQGLRDGEFVFGKPLTETLDKGFLWYIDFQGRALPGSNDIANILRLPAPSPNRSLVVRAPSPGSRSLFFDSERHTLVSMWALIHPLMETTIVSVETASYYKFFRKQSNPCDIAKQRFNSILEQEAESFYDRCGCWPSAFFQSTANLSSARPDCYDIIRSVCPVPNSKYFARLPWSSVGPLSPWYYFADRGDATNVDKPSSYNFSSQCNETTPSPAFQNIEECDMIHFTISQTIEQNWQKEHDRPLIRIKVRNELYNAIIESPYKTWSTFMSEFGGSIGTWLGGSLIAFVHIPVFFGRIALHYYKKTKTVDSNSEG